MTNQDYRRKLDEHYKLLADDSEITASAAARNLNGWAPQAIEDLLSKVLYLERMPFFCKVGGKNDFESHLSNMLNHFSLENGSDTPDFILAHYMVCCLSAFNDAVRKRNKWYAPPAGTTEHP